VSKAEDEQQAGDERRWDLAVARQRELRPLLENPNRTRAEVEAAASRLNVHPSTVYRLLDRYAISETAQAVVTRGQTGLQRPWLRQLERGILGHSAKGCLGAATKGGHVHGGSAQQSALKQPSSIKHTVRQPMSIVKIGANGDIEIIEPCTEEEAARADTTVIAIAEALGRLMACRDYDEAIKARIAACESTTR
jgi:hypothetical protein